MCHASWLYNELIGDLLDPLILRLLVEKKYCPTKHGYGIGWVRPSLFPSKNKCLFRSQPMIVLHFAASRHSQNRLYGSKYRNVFLTRLGRKLHSPKRRLKIWDGSWSIDTKLDCCPARIRTVWVAPLPSTTIFPWFFYIESTTMKICLREKLISIVF